VIQREGGIQLNRKAYLIAECNRKRCARRQPLRWQEAWELDALWNDDFHHSGARVADRRTKRILPGLFPASQTWPAPFRKGFVYQGQYSKYRDRRHGSSSLQISAHRFIVFCAETTIKWETAVRVTVWHNWYRFEQLKLAAATVLFSPYVSIIVYGRGIWRTSTIFPTLSATVTLRLSSQYAPEEEPTWRGSTGGGGDGRPSR